MLNLLFLGGGRRVKLLRFFAEALKERGGGRLVTTDTELWSSTSFVADRTYQIPLFRDVSACVDAIEEIAARERIHAIIPLRCDALATIPELRRRLHATIVSGDDDATASHRQAGDKRILLAMRRRYAELVDDLDHADLPLYFRPRYGQAGVGVRAVHTRRALEELATGDGVFTSYVEGREFTSDGDKGQDGPVGSGRPSRRLRFAAAKWSDR